MKIQVDSITVVMTPEEACVVAALIRNCLEDDPYGDASKDLVLPVCNVVEIVDNFRKGLEKIL